jgi:hypothetical protein
MLRGRQINSAGAPRLRSTVATATGPVRDAAWAVEERLVWRGADLLKAVLDVLRGPFERLAWVLEQRVVWPLQERAGELSPPLRSAAAAALAATAIALGVAGLLLATSGDGGGVPAARTVAARVAHQPRSAEPAAAAPAPILHGAVPLFAPAVKGGAKASHAPAEQAEAGGGGAAAIPADASGAASSATPAQVAGPEAIAAARRFADAFVLYETGQVDPEVRAAFHATTIPKLSASLLRRPPRLPANVEVPKAKVLNVVPGPRLGDDSTVSVSLLRVGLTSELRLSMHRVKSGEWLVGEVLG